MLGRMQAAVEVRTFVMRQGQAMPVMLRAGHLPPAPGIVGLPDGEPALRRAAAILAACGLAPPAVTAIDLRPAQAQAWPGLGLPLAVILLAADGRIGPDSLERFVFAADVTASGHLGPIDGIEAIAVQTARRGLVLLCADCQAEAAAASGSEAIGASDLAQVVDHLAGRMLLIPAGLIRAGLIRAGITGMAEQAVAPPTLAAPPPFSSTGPHGHRGRMRDRVRERGCASLADYELLEMLLFLAFRSGDTKPLAKALINRFGSFAGVLAAPLAELEATPGLGPHAVTALRIVREAAERLSRAELAERPLLNNWDRLIAYLNTMMVRETIEQFRVLFLDTRNRLLGDEVQARGTVNHTPVYPREVVRRALELQATALILVHNHPSGDPTPSTEDIDMTRDVRKAAAALGIVLHDHIIIGAGGHCSLRREGLM